MCVNCLRTQVDITEGMQKQATVLWCKDCGRYLQPPKHWLHAEPESKELLTFCLKKLKGLQKVDAAPPPPPPLPDLEFQACNAGPLS